MKDTSIDHFVALLRVRVPLLIPNSSIPYTEVLRSSLHGLGHNAFERQDQWYEFLDNYRRAHGTERTQCSLSQLRQILASLEEADVKPVVATNDPTKVTTIGACFSRLVAGEIALRWFEPAEFREDVVLANKTEAIWIRRNGDKLEELDRWELSQFDVLFDLTILTENIIPRTALPPLLLEQGLERLAKIEDLRTRLHSDAALCFKSGTGAYVAKGEQFPWICFWENHNARPYVGAMTECHLQQTLSRTLSETPERGVTHREETLRARCTESERLLRDCYEELLAGAFRLQRNSSVRNFEFWHGGAGFEVLEDHTGTQFLGVQRIPEKLPDLSFLAGMIQKGPPYEPLVPVPETFRAAVEKYKP